jgi:hypothetical protein
MIPAEFSFIQSTQKANYNFTDVSINGENITSIDWVGAFNGDICVGARQWDTSQCDGGVCAVPVMGYDALAPDLTAGYMLPGDIPTFKIYDASENTYHDAIPSENISWTDLGEPFIESLQFSGNCIDLHYAANLISFSTLPANGLDDIPECINGILGEGSAAQYLDEWGWIGSLTELSCEDGYWLQNTCADFTWCYEGMECSDSISYSLDVGNNLISYPFSECGNIEEVLPEDVQDCIDAILGSGTAVLNLGDYFVGSLQSLCPDDGYWFISLCDIEFTFNEPTGLARQMELSPSPYPYNQSSQQAFYFIESVENIEIGDWILSFNGETIIGARAWQGITIDVPVMGSDGTDYTADYIQAGSIPTFKLLSGGKLIDLTGEIPAFENNQLYMVSSLSKAILLPETFSLSRAYPNPFNPTTTLSFALPIESAVSLTVYNLQGREVISLVDQNMPAGYHSVVWNADNNASGMYFVKMVAGNYINTQKLMLVK